MWITREDLISSGNGKKKTPQTKQKIKAGTKNLVFNLHFYL